jgi:hypothetical protein
MTNNLMRGPLQPAPLRDGTPSSGDATRNRVMRRLSVLSHRAVEVLADAMESPDERVRVVAAQEVLNRRFGKPRQEAEVRVQVQDMATLHLQALKTLAEQGLRSVQANDAALIEGSAKHGEE